MSSNMIRTQVYLTASEKKALESIAKVTGESQSVLIREAIEKFIKDHKTMSRPSAMQKAFGLWKDRADIIEFSKIRSELDRKFNNTK